MTSLKNDYVNNIPLLNEAEYMKGELYSDTYSYISNNINFTYIYKVLNHPDKLLKVINVNNNTIYKNILKYDELKCSYIAGELGVGLKIYGYYIKDGDIHMIIEIIDETEIENDNTDYKTIFQNENMYNKLLKATDILLDNGIVNPNIVPSNIIIKKDGSIKIINYSYAYQIPKLSLSRALTGILLINWTKKYDTIESMNTEVSKRLASIINNNELLVIE